MLRIQPKDMHIIENTEIIFLIDNSLCFWSFEFRQGYSYIYTRTHTHTHAHVNSLLCKMMSWKYDSLKSFRLQIAPNAPKGLTGYL